MKTYLLDRNPDMIEAWKVYFENEPDVEVVHDDFTSFMDSHQEVDLIVSPANSFGIMNGGYDAAITKYFGRNLFTEVQRRIKYCWHGEQPIGTCLAVNIPTDNRKILLHTPTMRVPSIIIDPTIVYTCMRTTLLTAYDMALHRNDSVVVPAFGVATGKVPYDVVAKMMWLGYKQVTSELPEKIGWHYAYGTYEKLEE